MTVPVVPVALCEQLTDAAHAERFAESFALQLRFNHRRGAWLYYDRHLWRPDVDGRVYRMALEFVRGRQAEAIQISDRKLKEEVVGFSIKAESKAALDRLVGLARNFKPLADAGNGWDADPWLVGAPNGVVDLRTGELRDGDPADRITMTLGVPYDPTARAERFEQFILEIFDGDAELIGFVQRFLGYALSGLTQEQVLAVFWGRGANGKSTLLNLLRYVFGDYAHNMPFSTIEMRQRSSIPNDLAALDGRRFVTASETNDGTRLNEARIKALTGCDPMTARFLHGEWFCFEPVAKFVLAVNHKPTVTDDSHGFWRRIRLVPFTRTFSGSSREEGLEERLRREGPGILRWVVEGCLAWQANGLGDAAAIRDVTAEYQADSDPLADFLEECCDFDAGAVTKASALHEAYQKWADKHRLMKAERLSAKDFGRRTAERFVRSKGREGWSYSGVKVDTGRLW